MSISCLMRSMWTKQFHDHSFTSLGVVMQPIYICSSPLATGKALCWGMSQVQSFDLLALLPVSFLCPFSSIGNSLLSVCWDTTPSSIGNSKLYSSVKVPLSALIQFTLTILIFFSVLNLNLKKLTVSQWQEDVFFS